MGLISSIFRFVSTLFGQAEGKTERLTDELLTASPEAIRNQYRKVKEDWLKDKREMENALSQLVALATEKENEQKRLRKLIEEMQTKMQGAIAQYKSTQDEQYKTYYAKCAAVCEEAEAKIAALDIEIAEQNEVVNSYRDKLRNLTEEIKNLDKEEAETLADKKINEINSKLQGLANTSQSKNLEVIREARKQLKASTKLHAEISGTADQDFERKLLATGKMTKHMDAFDEAVKLDKIFIASEPIKELPKPKNNPIFDTEVIPKDIPIKQTVEKGQSQKSKPVDGVDQLFS